MQPRVLALLSLYLIPVSGSWLPKHHHHDVVKRDADALRLLPGGSYGAGAEVSVDAEASAGPAGAAVKIEGGIAVSVGTKALISTTFGQSMVFGKTTEYSQSTTFGLSTSFSSLTTSTPSSTTSTVSSFSSSSVETSSASFTVNETDSSNIHVLGNSTLSNSTHTSNTTSSVTGSASATGSVSLRDIYQARQNFGVNFGSLFVLERWIYGEMFVNGATVELDAIRNYISANGRSATQQKLEDHWNNYCNESEWRWLKAQGIQSVRIPVGYWHVGGGEYADDTDFSDVASVYKNAWDILINKYIKVAAKYDISVLVDLHALPKGANTDEHSGENFTTAGFWTDNSAQQKVYTILKFMARELADYDNVSGLQIVNEAIYDEHAVNQKKYYAEAIRQIRTVNHDIPIVFSDGWMPEDFADWLVDNGDASLGAEIDDHVYRAFSDADTSTSADTLISDLNDTILPDNSSDIADFLVGEYSCLLSDSSLSQSSSSHEDLTVDFGNQQVEIFKERAHIGYYFWTFKFASGDGGAWDFKKMVANGAIPSRKISLRLPTNTFFEKLLSSHKATCTSSTWCTTEAYVAGFTTGWADCTAFARFDNSRIGRVTSWIYRREREYTASAGDHDADVWRAGYQRALDIWASWD